MSVLAKRRRLISGPEAELRLPRLELLHGARPSVLRGFHAPQREHVKQPMPARRPS